ncbi:serine/threonine-protein kinase [Streptomyces sp. NPDC003333]
MSELPATQTGDRIDGRYRVLGRLGGGTYGQVFRVADDHLGNEVALKLLTPKQNEPATWDEAQVLERLRSPYLLPVLNADLVDDTDIRYITTPVITGGDLEDVADGFGVDALSAVRWGEHLGYGLDRMHREGLLHRDVKPGNAYLDDNGHVLLGDLGMAAAMDADGKASATGSYATVAPEVVSPEDPGCSIATDIYSLAATVFYLLTGHYPSGPRSMGNIERSQKVRAGEFLDLRTIAPHVSPSVARTVEQGLSLDPAQRPKSAQDFANQLASCSHYDRSWRRIEPHPGHEACFLGGSTRTALGVKVCAIPEQPGKFAIQVQLSSGRRKAQHEKHGLTPPQLLAALRKIAKNI